MPGKFTVLFTYSTAGRLGRGYMTVLPNVGLMRLPYMVLRVCTIFSELSLLTEEPFNLAA